MEQPNENAISLQPWSATKVKRAKKCPFSFHACHVEKEKEVHKVMPSTSAANVGIGIHSIIEEVLNEYPRDIDPTTDMHVLYEVTEKAVASVAKDPQLTEQEKLDIALMSDSAREVCTRVLNFIYLNPGSKIFMEEELAFNKNFVLSDYKNKMETFFRGKMDLLIVTPNGNAAILDFKTGQWAKLKDNGMQLKTYELLLAFCLVDRLVEEGVAECKSVTSGIANIPNERIEWDAKRPITYVKDQGRSSLVKQINAVSDEVFEKKIKRGSHCDPCGYKHLCGSRRGMGKKKETKLSLEDIKL